MKESSYLFIQSVAEIIQYLFPFVDIDIASFIACQSAVETAYGRSTIYLENHNLFGMKLAVNRLQSCIGSSRGHALYFDYDQSIFDYFLWLSFHGFKQSDLAHDLGDFIKKFPWSSYCPSDIYLSSIQSVYKSFKSYAYE